MSDERIEKLNLESAAMDIDDYMNKEYQWLDRCEFDIEQEEIIMPNIKMDVDNIFYSDIFFDDGYIANHIIGEFGEIFDMYGLCYDLGFSWTLTTYRK